MNSKIAQVPDKKPQLFEKSPVQLHKETQSADLDKGEMIPVVLTCDSLHGSKTPNMFNERGKDAQRKR